ncbi:MAG: preprotein translocase subunit YajC [Alphaproteobacteria bacterium]|nr:preprotein translocase subunit YajC [Alphaproteobacteria bacterium]
MNENISFFVMMAAIFAIFYFMIIRPQNKRMKDHRDMVANLRRGDTVVFSGGLIGKIKKVMENDEAIVEVADGVQLKIVKQSVTEVRAKSEPSADQ